MDGTEPARPDRGSPDVGRGDEPREIPAAPFVPNRPWRIVLAAGVVCLVALLVLVSLAKDRASDVPPVWLFAASGIVVAGIGGYAVWLAALQSRLVSRSAIALGAGFACIAVAKFALAPFGFFDQTRSRTIALIVSQQMLIVVAGLGVLVLYVIAIRVIRRVARSRLTGAPKGRTAALVGTLLGLVAIGVALPIVLIVAAGPYFYLRLVFTSVVGLGVAVALIAATGFVNSAFLTAEDRAQVLARASMLATAAWIAFAFVVLFQVLWIVFMLTLVAIWPLRTVTPK
jgi:hypothetical protein